MQITKKILIIEKTQKEYNINGNTGISHKVRALVDMQDIFVFKFSAENLSIFEKIPSKGEVSVHISITSPKEELKAEIIAIANEK